MLKDKMVVDKATVDRATAHRKGGNLVEGGIGCCIHNLVEDTVQPWEVEGYRRTAAEAEDHSILWVVLGAVMIMVGFA